MGKNLSKASAILKDDEPTSDGAGAGDGEHCLAGTPPKTRAPTARTSQPRTSDKCAN